MHIAIKIVDKAHGKEVAEMYVDVREASRSDPDTGLPSLWMDTEQAAELMRELSYLQNTRMRTRRAAMRAEQ